MPKDVHVGPEGAHLVTPRVVGDTLTRVVADNPNPNLDPRTDPKPEPKPTPNPNPDPDPDPNPDPEPNPSPTQVSNDTQNRQFYSDIRKSAAPAARFEVMGSLSEAEPGAEAHAES